MRYLTSIFGLNDTTFSYGEFAEVRRADFLGQYLAHDYQAMTNMGFFEDVEAGMLVPYAHLVQPFAYNPVRWLCSTMQIADFQRRLGSIARRSCRAMCKMREY